MTANEIILYTTLGTAMSAVFGVAVSVLSHRREINASIYLDLSDRLHRLLQSLPVEVRAAQISGEELPTFPATVAPADYLHIINSADTLYSSCQTAEQAGSTPR